MRLLVLGGTVFLSRAVAVDALGHGYDVTCASRGRSGTVPRGVRQIGWDRDQPAPADLVAEDFDAVIDVARHPSRVGSAVAAWPGAHWVFVSSVNVYPDTTTPQGTPENLAVHDPRTEDVDLAQDPEAYGPMKVACEQIVQSAAASSTIVRPGLIVGPGDPTGRFTYWPQRIAAAERHEEVAAPGSPWDLVQVIDVRDLASWLVDLAARRRQGVFDGVGEPMPMVDLLSAVVDGVGTNPILRWIDQDFLASHAVNPWTGPRSLPLWLPRPEYDGMLSHDVAAPKAAGLGLRPIAETARDTLAWTEQESTHDRTGLTLAEEAEVLAAWHEQTGR